jgi:hypothetical protein
MRSDNLGCSLVTELAEVEALSNYQIDATQILAKF